jgi:hypothetical protein
MALRQCSGRNGVTRLLTRFIVVLIIPMLLVVLLVRLQRPHDTDVLRLLINDACAAPCFIGIQPGITPVGEAVKILEAHEWVQHIEARYTDFGQSTNTFWGYVYWEWKPGIPLWTYSPAYNLGLHQSYLRILDGHVNEIAFSTSLPLGAAVLSLGTNGTYVLDRPDRYSSRPYPVIQHFYFSSVGIVLGSISLCPAVKPDWHQATVVKLWTPDYFDSFMQVTRAIGSPLTEARRVTRVGCR